MLNVRGFGASWSAIVFVQLFLTGYHINEIDTFVNKASLQMSFQEKFGDDIDITAGKKKIGTKHADEYSSDADTDDLANDSDLDVETCRSNIATLLIFFKRVFHKVSSHLSSHKYKRTFFLKKERYLTVYKCIA